MKEKVEFECFDATDAEGQTYKIFGYQCYITHAPVYGQPVVLKGDVEYWTACGKPVLKIDSKTFRVLAASENISHIFEKFISRARTPKAIELSAINRYDQ